MKTRKKQRLWLIIVVGIIWSAAAGLFLWGFSQNISYFKDPTDLLENSVSPTKRIQLGGLVAKGSYIKGDGTKISFRVTDGQSEITVHYEGEVPDLFREGQGVIAEGKMNEAGDFLADSILAKHDETYMPKEVADSLKKRGVWQGENE